MGEGVADPDQRRPPLHEHVGADRGVAQLLGEVELAGAVEEGAGATDLVLPRYGW